jgi:hypothetical protein
MTTTEETAADLETGRERLGRLVRDTWVAAVRDLAEDPKPSWLIPWDDLDEFQREADMRIGEAVAARCEAAADAPPVAMLLPPVADFGPVRLELMGHRYREGRLSEVVIAGTPFLRLDLEGGAVEMYRPDAVYCITPGIVPPPVPRAAIPERFGWQAVDEAEDTWGDGDDD